MALNDLERGGGCATFLVMPRIRDDRFLDSLGAIQEHRAEPSVSLAALMARRKRELANWVLKRKRVYLDTKYWVFLRDASLGEPAHPTHRVLLEALAAGVRDGRLLCPLNESVIFELEHQRDPAKHAASLALMDDLSLGVVIQNGLERVRTEVWHFLKRLILDQSVPSAPLEHVWLKVGHFLGTPVPSSPGWSETEQLVAQKAYLDFAWSLTLEEMFSDTEFGPDTRDSDEALAVRLTEQSAEEADKMRSFKRVYVAELAGFWDGHESMVSEVLVELFKAAVPDGGPIPPQQLDEQTRLYKNALRNLIRLDRVGSSLPTAQIVSGLHALIRWNRNRGFQRTDFYDFRHAAAAVPYCDLFLTERFLANALTSPPLSFDTRFSTIVEHDTREALARLAELHH